MLAQVTVTNSLNLTTIIAISAIFFAAAAYIVPKIFKLAQQILKEFYDLRTWMIQYQRQLTDEQKAHLEQVTAIQTKKIEDCIHQVPGHPEESQPQ